MNFLLGDYCTNSLNSIVFGFTAGFNLLMPVVFAICLLKYILKKKKLNNVVKIILGIVLFFIIFLIMGGIKEVITIISNNVFVVDKGLDNIWVEDYVFLYYDDMVRLNGRLSYIFSCVIVLFSLLYLKIMIKIKCKKVYKWLYMVVLVIVLVLISYFIHNYLFNNINDFYVC